MVIDGPPRASDLARSVIMAADFVLIPVQPSPYDLWAAQETVGLIQEAMTYKPSLKAAFIMNRKAVNTAISKSAKEALGDLPFPVPSSKTAISSTCGVVPPLTPVPSGIHDRPSHLAMRFASAPPIAVNEPPA